MGHHNDRIVFATKFVHTFRNHAKSIDIKTKKIRLSIKEMEAPSPVQTPSSSQYINNRENIGSTLAHALADVKIGNQHKE